MKFVLPVQGTHAWDDSDAIRWWKDASPFHQALYAAELEFLLKEDPFVWTTEVDGLERLQRKLEFWKWFSKRRPPIHRDWVACGRGIRLVYSNALGRPVPIRKRMIGHSHGGQGCIYAAAQGLEIDRLITVGTPKRADMTPALLLARPNIDKWLHIEDPDSDRIQFGGQFGDGAFNLRRRDWPEGGAPDRIDTPEGIGHSEVLRTRIECWQENGWFDFLKEV